MTQPKDTNPLNTETADPPEGYVFRAVSKSQKEAVSSASYARSKSIVKAAIQHYINTWFDELGRNRILMTDISPQSIQFILDKNFDENEDITKRPIQIARWFDELKERLPCILIMDGGATYIASSLGDYDRSEVVAPGEYRLRSTLTMKVPVELTIGSEDPETTDSIISMLAFIFGSARRLGGGNTLHSQDPNDHWEVRLPMSNISFGNISNQNITEDQKDSIWTSTVSLELDFEDTLVFGYTLDFTNDNYTVSDLSGYGSSAPLTGYVADVSIADTLVPLITAPATIRLNSPHALQVSRISYLHNVYIDNPGVATIDPSTFIITPKRLGTFKVLVALTREGTPNILTTHEFQVVV